MNDCMPSTAISMVKPLVFMLVLLGAHPACALTGPWDHPPKLPAPRGRILKVKAGDAVDLAAKCKAARSGTTILVPRGTYRLTARSGPLRIGAGGPVQGVALCGMSSKRDEVVIRGPGMRKKTVNTVPHCLMIENAREVLVANLSIGDVWYHPITLQGKSGAQKVRIFNCRLFDAGEQFLKSNPGRSGGVNDGIVEYCLFEYTTNARWNYTEGIDVHRGKNWIVRNNLFRNIRGPKNDAKVGGAIDFWNNSQGTLIENNTIYNCRFGIRLGIVNKFAKSKVHDHVGGIIRNNVIYRDPGAVHEADNGILLADCPGAKVLHNTVILNGTFDFGKGGVCMEYRWSDGVVFENNLADGMIWARGGKNITNRNNVLNASSKLFADARRGDFHLVPGSAVIDRVPPHPEVPKDMDGQKRPFGAKADIGADEFRPGK